VGEESLEREREDEGDVSVTQTGTLPFVTGFGCAVGFRPVRSGGGDLDGEKSGAGNTGSTLEVRGVGELGLNAEYGGGVAEVALGDEWFDG
jgi:hypothetical protein